MAVHPAAALLKTQVYRISKSFILKGAFLLSATTRTLIWIAALCIATAPAFTAPALAADETEPTPPPQEAAPTPPAGENAALRQEIEELRQQVKAITDAAEIRQALTETDAEKREKEENILDAAGRQYTLMQKGKLGFEYQLVYSGYRYDAIQESNTIEHNSNHNFKNNFILEYPLMNNLTLGTRLPFIYEYDQVGADGEKDVTDWGDVIFYADYQPVKSGGRMPSIIMGAQVSCPMGRSPYEVNPEEDLPTGSGGYSTMFSVNASKSLDPVLAYGSLSYEYNHPIDNLDYKMGANYTLEKYEPGDTITASIGMGFALSYKTSITLAYSNAYSLRSKRYYVEQKPQRYATSSASSMQVGTSWRFGNNRRMNVTLSTGLNNSGNHSIAFAFPLEFDL